MSRKISDILAPSPIKSVSGNAHRTAADILRASPAPASINPRVNEILGIKGNAPEAVRAGAPVGNHNAAGKHEHQPETIKRGNEHSLKSYEAHEAAIDNPSKENHMKAMQAASDAHHFWKSVSPRRSGLHLAMAEQHKTEADKLNATSRTPDADTVKATDEQDTVTARASDVIHCRAAASSIGPVTASDAPWKQGVETNFMYMPAGQHTICAGFRGKSVVLTVKVDPEADAQTVQASLANLVSKYPKQKPFGCIEHEEKDASVWAKGFSARADGIYLAAEPSAMGENHVNGRIHRSWSPSFLTDADYAKAKLNKYPSGEIYEFPDGVKGSESNPAKITGIAFCVGTLTNNPAFKDINPVRAKEMATMTTEQDKVTAGAPVGNKNASKEHRKELSEYLDKTAEWDKTNPISKEGHERYAKTASYHSVKLHEKGFHDGGQVWAGIERYHRARGEHGMDHDKASEYAHESIFNKKIDATSTTPDDAVRATWSDAAREAAALARKSGMHAEAHRLSAHANSLTAAIGDNATKMQHSDAAAAHEKAHQAHSDLHVLHGENKLLADHHDMMRAGHEAAYATASDTVAATDRTVSSILGEPSPVDRILAGAQPGNKNAAGPHDHRGAFKVGTKVKTDSGEVGEISHVQHSNDPAYPHQYKVTDTKANDPYKQKRLESGHFIPHNRLTVHATDATPRTASTILASNGKATSRPLAETN